MTNSTSTSGSAVFHDPNTATVESMRAQSRDDQAPAQEIELPIEAQIRAEDEIQENSGAEQENHPKQ